MAERESDVENGDIEGDVVPLGDAAERRARPSKVRVRCTEGGLYALSALYRYITCAVAITVAVSVAGNVILFLERVPPRPPVHAPSLTEREIKWMRDALEAQKAIADPLCDHNRPATCHVPSEDQMQEMAQFLCGNSAVYIRHARSRNATELTQPGAPLVDIIVPYRARREQLVRFMLVVPTYLALRGMRAKIHVAHQTDDHDFNKGVLINTATRDVGPYHCMHDVDVWPLAIRNMYMHPGPMTLRLLCTRFTNRASAVVLSGGVYCVDTAAVRAVNGFPNAFRAWGQEDNAMEWRLLNHRDVTVDAWQSGLCYNIDTPSEGRPMFLALSGNVDKLYHSFYRNPNCSAEFAADLTKASCFTAHGGLHDVDDYVADVRTHASYEMPRTHTEVTVTNVTTTRGLSSNHRHGVAAFINVTVRIPARDSSERSCKGSSASAALGFGGRTGRQRARIAGPHALRPCFRVDALE